VQIDALRAGWERLGERDPLWAVLTDPSKRGGRWTRDDFLASGTAEIAAVFARLARFGVHPTGRALDFGCGAGRLTQALAQRFSEAHGVDIAEAMLTTARELDPPDNAIFHHNAAADLALFEDDTFDFVYSSIVLQHMPPPLALAYIREFVRISAPSATIVFQAPDQYRPPPVTLADKLHRVRGRVALRSRVRGRSVERLEPAADSTTLAAHPTPEALVLVALAEEGASIVDIAVTNSVDIDFNGNLRYAMQSPATGWVSKQYTALVD
jgi:SAM-dependent methyltransferase